MLDETIRLLAPKPGETAIDVTVGGGGHASKIIERIVPGGTFLGIDRDPDAVSHSSRELGADGIRIFVIQGRMGDVADIAGKLGIVPDLVLADLGVSSHQFDSSGRGFSFRNSGPLDMRMDRGDLKSAADVLDELSEEELERAIREYGEERMAGRIARAIKARGKMDSTAELGEIISRACPKGYRYGRIHPATRTFQALRILINDEMGELERLLEDVPDMLSSGGRFAVMSYHSLEDRRVKTRFRALSSGGGFEVLTKKPVVPSDGEVEKNPRARSAKLRAMRRK
jgi:16S rRNA (cytosine1402-N4)-methyltransferase